MPTIDFEQKYRKYKLKYEMLKRGHRGGQRSGQRGSHRGGQGGFRAIYNNGSDGSPRYSNQCMWLSILYYLQNVFEQRDLTLEELRRIASADGALPINGEREIFDDEKHLAALEQVCQRFNLQIHFYGTKRSGNGYEIHNIDAPRIVGQIDSPFIVPIVSYGYHFQLISEMDDRNPFEALGDLLQIEQITKDSEQFKIDKTVVLGKNLDGFVGADEEKEKLLDSYLEDLNSNLNISLDVKTNIDLLRKQQKNLEESPPNMESDQERVIAESIRSEHDRLSRLLKDSGEYLELLNRRIEETKAGIDALFK